MVAAANVIANSVQLSMANDMTNNFFRNIKGSDYTKVFYIGTFTVT